MSFVCTAESTDIDLDGPKAVQPSAAEQVRVGSMLEHFPKKKTLLNYRLSRNFLRCWTNTSVY